MALGPSEDHCRMCASPDAWQTEQLRANDAWRALNASTWNATTGQSQFQGQYYDVQLGAQQSYLDCATYVSANHVEGQLTLPEVIESFSIFWTPLFWLRWQYPEQATFFVKNGIFEMDSVLGRMALAAWQACLLWPVLQVAATQPAQRTQATCSWWRWAPSCSWHLH